MIGTVTDRELLDLIHGTEWIAHSLMVDFDFDLERMTDGWPEAVVLPDEARLTFVAGDSSGGGFALVGEQDVHPVVYLSSEGEGGMIALGLRDALALVVGLSSIHDATMVPIDEDREGLLAWLAKTDEEIREDNPDLDVQRARLVQALGLPDAYDVLPAFHAAARDERFRPWNPIENIPYAPMVGPDPYDEWPTPLPGALQPPAQPAPPPAPIEGQTELF